MEENREYALHEEKARVEEASKREETFVIHKHIFFLIAPFVAITLLSILSAIGIFIFFGLVIAHGAFLVICLFILLTLLSTVFSKLYADWLFHFYILSPHKIVELQGSPLFSDITNDILLNQVRCTEIDVRVAGVFGHLIDMGDVVVTFDRPTLREEFVFSSVANPSEIASLLEKVLLGKGASRAEGAWYKSTTPSQFHFYEEIFSSGTKYHG